MANQDLSKTNTTIGNQSFLSRVSSTLRHSTRVNIIIQLLDDTEQITLSLKSSATGQAVLDAACQELNIVEREFFGLRYQDNNKFRFWLDLTKPVNKQLKGTFIFLSLRFRFYPLHPSLLKEDITRYQLFVQLRRDLLHGRLYCTQNDAIQLAGLILQAVLGDYDPVRHPMGYVSEYKLIIKQTERLEDKIAEYHKQLRGMNSIDAEREFVNLATSIETYGFDPYIVKDGKQSQDLSVGATCRGILVFSRNQLLKNIPWKYLSKIDYTGKELKIYPTKDLIEYENGGGALNNSFLDVTMSTMNSDTNISNIKSSSPTKKAQFKFICPSSTFAKHLWRHLLSQQAFFTADEARLVKPKFSRPRIPLFSRGSTFRCPTQKVLHEIEQTPLAPREEQPITFTRYPLPKQLSRSDISAPTSRTGTLKSVRSSKVSPTPKIVEESFSPPSESESIPEQNTLKRTESSDTLTTSPVLFAPATSTPNSSKIPEFAFTPPKGSNSVLNTTLESQVSSTTSIQTTSDEDLSYRNNQHHQQNYYQPSTTTSMMEEEKPIEKILQQDYDEEFPPLPSSTATQGSNGTTTTTTFEQQTIGHTNNGDENAVKKRNSRAANKIIKEDTVTKKIMRTVLTIFMFVIIFASIAIIMFEANDGKGVKWTREIYPVSSFRQIVYDPSKDAVQQVIRRFY